ncbi:MAG: hypothetical protein AB8G17_06545 [Gammaproteobacteria bacterium]
MYALHQSALIFHIVCGAVALILFWIPVATRKGSPIHKKVGKWFLLGMTAIAVSGIFLAGGSLLDPIGVRNAGQELPMADAFQQAESIRVFSLFLLMLSVLVLLSSRHATLVLKARDNRALLRTPFHVGAQIATLILSIATGIVGFANSEVLLIIFFFVGMSGALGTLHYTFKKELKKNEWIVEHIGATIGCGIAAYTAFFAFGGRAMMSHILSGQWQILPWVLPSVIGLFFARRVKNAWREKFSIA